MLLQQRVGLSEGTEGEVKVVPSEFWKRLDQKHNVLTTQLRSRYGGRSL